MWVRGNGWMGFLLCGRMVAALRFFSLAIPIVVAWVAGGSGCFVCTWGSHAHWLRLVLFFDALIALQGLLPDIKCETDVNINLLEKCKF